MNAITTINTTLPEGFADWMQTGRSLLEQRADLAIDLIKELVAYDSETGALTWKRRPISLFSDANIPAERACRTWNTRYFGKPALQSINSGGYRHGCIFGLFFTAHQIAWCVHHGRWPTGEIDHINGRRCDNRIVNLRDVTALENRRNQTRSSANRSGATGVHWCNTERRWVARIKIGQRTVVLGYFRVKEDAIAARAKANAQYGFHEGHGKEAAQ